MPDTLVDTIAPIKCISCHCNHSILNYIRDGLIFKCCSRCREVHAQYSRDHSEKDHIRKYGTKSREQCDCGSTYYLYSRASHLKSKKHQLWTYQHSQLTEPQRSS